MGRSLRGGEAVAGETLEETGTKPDVVEIRSN